MPVLESLRIAFGNLALHKLRTGLTMLGMIFGVGAVLSMVSIGSGAEQEALSVIEKMGLRNILVRAKDFEPNELRVLRQDSSGLSSRDMEALGEALPSGTLVGARKRLKPFQVLSEWGKADSLVSAVTPAFSIISNLGIEEGSFLLPIDDKNANQVCILGSTARRKLFGLNEAVGEQIKVDREWFTVIGIYADKSSNDEEFQGVKLENTENEIHIPLGVLRHKFELGPLESELDEIIVQIPRDASLQDQAELVSSQVASMHRNIDDFSVVVPEELLEQSRETQRIFNIVMGAIASISLLVGGIGIMNIMLASVLERTSEIGLRRAVGARRRDISRQFVLESIAISVTGALIGIGFGLGIAELVSVFSGWATVVTPASIAISVGVSLSVGLVFGIYPARQAAKISPIEALRYE